MLGQLIASCTFVDCLHDVASMCGCAENEMLRVVIKWLPISIDMFSSVNVTMFLYFVLYFVTKVLVLEQFM